MKGQKVECFIISLISFTIHQSIFKGALTDEISIKGVQSARQTDQIACDGRQQIYQYLLMFVTRSRPKSNSVSSTTRPNFQIKYKSRNKMLTESSNHDTPFNLTAHTHYLKNDHQECERQNDFFLKTSQHLTHNNFAHHHEENCCCKDCTCGRHLCKLNVLRPGFTKKTIYKRSYFKQNPIENVVNHDKEYDKLKGPHLDMNTTYKQGYQSAKGDELERPHPEDLLQPGGPSQQLTSYANEFPGFRGDNQYVKPTDKHAIGYFPLRSKTTYSKEYTKKDNKKDDYKYIPDQLKTGSNWYGKTTYGNFYAQPDPEYFAKKVKIIEKLEENPNYNRQYQTVYKNDFIQKANPLCPAKIFLQTKGQGAFSDSKGNFAENSDFKAMSPTYHAISNSKHTRA